MTILLTLLFLANCLSILHTSFSCPLNPCLICSHIRQIIPPLLLIYHHPFHLVSSPATLNMLWSIVFSMTLSEFLQNFNFFTITLLIAWYINTYRRKTHSQFFIKIKLLPFYFTTIHDIYKHGFVMPPIFVKRNLLTG